MSSAELQARTESLSVLGARPAFDKVIHVGAPNVVNRAAFIDRLNHLIDQRWFSNNGPLVQEFEARIADAAGVSHCVATCNATLGLQLAVHALGLRGEVIVPSYTFIATAHVLQVQGITPVFADIDPRTHLLDPSVLEGLITPKTTGILPVHLWGRCCDVISIERIAQRHGLQVLYDAAHAFGCTHHGRPVGGFGRCEVFSFHATKFLNSFEGGAVVTNDAELAQKLRLLRNYGFAGYDHVLSLGTNGKMTEVCAAMGLSSLAGIQEIIAVNRENYRAYEAGLAGIPGANLLHYDQGESSNYQYIVVEVDAATFGLSRDQIVAVLNAENVLARRYFWPGCHRMEPYRSTHPDAGRALPRTELVAERVVVLPTGQAMNQERVSMVCGIIRTAQKRAAEVRRVLEPQCSGG